MKTKIVARINDVSVTLIDGTEKLVPTKPICELLGVDSKSQIVKIQNNEILGSVGVLSPSLGSDGKKYEMFCIPYKFIFGWLFTINPQNVKSDARERVLKYKMECYTALFNHFSDHVQFLEQKQNALEKQLEELKRIRSDYSDQKKLLANAKKTLNDIKEMTFEEWQINKRQLSINFPN